MNLEGLAFFDRVPCSPIISLEDERTRSAKVQLWLMRDDLIDPFIGGNKFRKLKYTLLAAAAHPPEWIVSVGGAHSNHLYALSFAAMRLGVKMLALVRGDEGHLDSPTIQALIQNGTWIRAVKRSDFREKNFAPYYADIPRRLFIPEGGTTALALRGCAELPLQIGFRYDVLAVPCGTGGTLAGIVQGITQQPQPHPLALGFAVLRGGFLRREVARLAGTTKGFQVIEDYHFGGYAKKTAQLIEFMDWFMNTHHIEIEHVYSGKMLFGLYDLMAKNYFEQGTKIIAVHTGGLRPVS